MKTNKETINSLLIRRDAYIKRKKQHTKLLACLLVMFSLSGFGLCALVIGKEYQSEPMLSEQETIIDSSSTNTNDDNAVSVADGATDPNSIPPRIYINELDAVPTRFMLQYMSTQFEAMTEEEMQSHFRIRLDLEEVFEDYRLLKEDHNHGFYVKPDGTIHEQDYFSFRNADNDKLVNVTLHGTNVADIYLLSDYYDKPIPSYVCGKKAYIFHWQDNENEELFCEFVFRDNVGVTIRMKNMGTSEMVDLIEYIVKQEHVFFEAEIIP